MNRDGLPSRPPVVERDSYHDIRRESYDSRRRNGRSQSPNWPEERGGKRRRSESPYDRQVRPRYDERDYSRRGRSRSPPHREWRPYSPERDRRGPRDPLTLDSLASFRQFCDWFSYMHPEEWRDAQSTARALEDSDDRQDTSANKRQFVPGRAQYDEYRRKFVRKQYKLMFAYHRKFAWFLEKYDMSDRYVDMRERVKKEGYNGTVDQFIIELEAGNFDPNPSSTSPVNVTKSNRGDEETSKMDIDVPQTPVFNTNEFAVPPSGPQLMIRTLPPDIGRLKLEEVLKPLAGFKHVAIGEPVQKRQFYRAAWVAFEFEEDVKKAMVELVNKKIDNFSLPLLQTTNSFVSKIRYTAPQASRLDRLEKDLKQAKKLASILETQAAEVAGYKPIWPVGARPSMDITEIVPAQTEDVKVEGTGESNPQRGSIAVEERIEKLISETIDTDEDGNIDKVKKVTLALDMYLAYLRRAFHCCYYCAVVADHPEELLRKCIKHERRSEVEPTIEENGGNKPDGWSDEKRRDAWHDERWADALDHKLACLLDRPNLDPSDFGGNKLDDEIAIVVRPHINKEDEHKWRCRACNKLFKASAFLEKHIVNKHSELVKAQLDEWELYNNFILDPQHILPMQAVPVSASGIAQHPPEAFGLPPTWRPSYSDRDRDRDRYRGRRSPSPRSYHNGGNESKSYSTALPIVPGLPAKPVDAMSSADAVVDSGILGRMSAALPPPPGAKVDPRARISYLDLDMVDGSDDVALQY